MKENYVQSKYSETWYKGGIVFQVIDSQVKKISLDIAKQLVADRTYAMSSTLGDVPVFVIVNNAISIEKEAKEFYNTENPYKRICCIAMLMNNYLARIAGNFVFLFDKQPVPIKFFNSKEKALEWLNSPKTDSQDTESRTDFNDFESN